MTKTPPSAAITPALAFLGADGARAGEDRFALLDAIDRLGSISAAAKAAGLSYRGAWDAVNALNNLFPRPLVVKQPGGRHGGGAEVTAEGRRALAMHRRLTEGLHQALADFDGATAAPFFWSFTMKTSARNAFHGVISTIECGPIHAEVALQVSDATTLTAIVTNKSAHAMGLYPGREAFALVKASAPILMAENDGARTSARNCICGEVVSVETGAVNADVVLDIGGGKTLSAIVTDDSVQALGLEPGVRACALIKASQIILGVE